jgi:hypothetical protein
MAWPILQTNNLLHPGAILFYLLTAFGLFGYYQMLRGKAGNVVKAIEPPKNNDQTFQTTTNVRSAEITEGDYYEFKLHDNLIAKVILHGIRPISKPQWQHTANDVAQYEADLELCDSLIFPAFGKMVQQVADYRWLFREGKKGSTEDYSVFDICVSEKRVNVFVFRVDHINPAAKKVTVTICEIEANRAMPLTARSSPK